MPSYLRQEREGKLPTSVKLAQGVGAIPDTIKNWVFHAFVLLYYSQILGVDPLLVSLALSLALIIDAIADPWIGSLSDNLHTKWGRRHPLMLLGAVPLAIGVGPGSELRRPLGIAIIGGLLVSQVLTLYTTPIIYLLLDKLHRRLWGTGTHAPAAPHPAEEK